MSDVEREGEWRCLLLCRLLWSVERSRLDLCPTDFSSAAELLLQATLTYGLNGQISHPVLQQFEVLVRSALRAILWLCCPGLSIDTLT